MLSIGKDGQQLQSQQFLINLCASYYQLEYISLLKFQIRQKGSREMDKKKFTAKEMFRTLAFHYHCDQKLPLDLLSDVVSGIYYPRDTNGEARKRYKQLLLVLMKQYSDGQKSMNEEQFCNYMNEMSKHKREQYSSKLTHRIFERYSQVDPDSKQKVIGEKGFKLMSQFMKIKADESLEYFKSVADRKNQIDFQRFNNYMNSLLTSTK